MHISAKLLATILENLHTPPSSLEAENTTEIIIKGAWRKDL
jgi:hypothetical protein